MILIALGSSLAFCGLTPQEIPQRALVALKGVARVSAVSQFYTSPAWPSRADPPFTNAVAALETALSPEALLRALHAVEAGFGRRRRVENGPRTLDLDLLDYDGLVRDASPRSLLILPHPRILERDFVLRPLSEVVPNWRHPVSGEFLSAILAAMKDDGAVPISTAGP